MQRYVEDTVAESIIGMGLHIGDTIIIDMAENGEETVATVKHHEEKVLEEAPIA